MVYRGPVLPNLGGQGHLGIRPTDEDHARVRAWWAMGLTGDEIRTKLGEQYGLEKPMSKQTLYYHFGEDLRNRKRGRKAKPETIARRVQGDIGREMQRMIDEIRRRKNEA